MPRPKVPRRAGGRANEPAPEIRIFRADRQGIRTVLGDLEAEVIETIWARPAGQGTTVRDVFEELRGRRRIAYTTVMSTMARLARKNLLRTEKRGQAYVYYPALTPGEFESHVAGRLLEDLLVSFSGPTVRRLEGLTDREVAERARRLLKEIARRRRLEEPT